MNLLFLLLVALMGSTDFRTREAATALVRKVPDHALPALLAGEGSTDNEIKERCRPIVDAWFRANAFEIVRKTPLPPGVKHYPVYKPFGDSQEEWCEFTHFRKMSSDCIAVVSIMAPRSRINAWHWQEELPLKLWLVSLAARRIDPKPFLWKLYYLEKGDCHDEHCGPARRLRAVSHRTAGRPLGTDPRRGAGKAG